MADAPADQVFTPEVIAQVSRHMNTDHGADNLLIVRTLGAIPDAQAAVMAGMDAGGIEFEAETPSGTVRVRLPWGEPVTERGQVRAEVVRMYEAASAPQ